MLFINFYRARVPMQKFLHETVANCPSGSSNAKKRISIQSNLQISYQEDKLFGRFGAFYLKFG